MISEKNLQPFEHGGDIYSLAEGLKMQERKIVDFSSSINPLGVSKKVKAEIRKCLKYIHNYPDPEVRRLRRFIAQSYGIDPKTILCGNGSTELIYLIVRALKPEKVLIPAPTFSEYERACRISAELRVTSYELKKENKFDINPDEFINAMEGKLPYVVEIQDTKPPLPHFTKRGQGGVINSSLVTRRPSLPFDMAFLCNPNNPTGRSLKREDVLKIADAAKDLKCVLVVDEAFIDFCPEDSVINNVQDNPYLIVLRSLTKFYALSGLRIGYGVFPKHLIEVLKSYKEPWTVNSLAQKAGVVALKDKLYREETLKIIRKEKQFLEGSFGRLGIEFFHSDVNFYLLRMNNADELYQRLKRKGILIRDCSNFRGLDGTFIRVAIKSHGENKILLKGLEEFLRLKR